MPIAGAAVGGALMLIVVVVIVHWWRRKNNDQVAQLIIYGDQHCIWRVLFLVSFFRKVKCIQSN